MELHVACGSLRLGLENKSRVCPLWASKLHEAFVFWSGLYRWTSWKVVGAPRPHLSPACLCSREPSCPSDHLNCSCRVDREGPHVFSPPWPASWRLLLCFKFSSCNSPEQGQHCPHVLLILCLVCVSLSLRKCVIQGRGLFLLSDPWQSYWVQKVAVS